MSLRLLAILLFPLATAHADTFGSGLKTFDMEFVTIGNANHAPDDTTHGSVGYTSQMGVHEVSRGMIDTYNSVSGEPTLTMFDMISIGGNVGFRVAAIPEPSAFLLALIGMVGVVMRRRRR